MPLTLRPLALAVILGLSPLALAAQDAGSYLAGRQAQVSADFAEAAKYFTRAMAADPGNPSLMQSAMTAHLATGDVARAATIARELIRVAPDNQFANLILIGIDARDGDWQELLDDLDAGQSVSPLFDGLIRGWALVGAGRVEEGLVQFDKTAETPGVRGFALYHKALALASQGRTGDALKLFEVNETAQIPRRGVLTEVELLSQTGRNDEALATLRGAFGTETDAVLTQMRARLEAGETLPFTIAPDARAGAAEVFYSIARALSVEASDAFTLLYTRMAQYVADEHIEATLLSANLLETLGQYDLAIDAFQQVPRDHPAFDAAEMGRAEVLRRSGRRDAAVEVVRQLARRRPDTALVHTNLGDILRELDRFEEARAAYDTAISLLGEDSEEQWIIYFARGITHERIGNWDKAEADFRKALDLKPGQPQVLNYLGYSYVERRENLDEALDMIERAVEARPDSGYIADSLGWVLYRLGRYEEAVAPMEKAVELMPVDPVLNDHLGDVYWAVGRKLEARFQWRRALSFVDNDQSGEVQPDRIRRKLEVGLDQVLAEEGADPLQVANDG